MKHCVLHPERKAITTAAHIPVCEECNTDYMIEGRLYLPFEERHFYRRLLKAANPELSHAAKEFAWRMEYAPHGFIYVTRLIDFAQLEVGYDARELIAFEVQCLHETLRQQLLHDGPFKYDEGRAFTRITVFPKQLGECLNHLDPLGIRMGIELEMRWPVASAADFKRLAG